MLWNGIDLISNPNVSVFGELVMRLKNQLFLQIGPLSDTSITHS